jgi:exopolyphosphatase/pppGpp-phosphohydrolase
LLSDTASKEDPAQTFFKGIAPENLHKNAETRKKLEEMAAALKKFNTWVDAVVERRNGFYFIKDARITI